MIAIIALDERGGMLFNHRRQSRDIKLCERIIEITRGSKLWVGTFSAKLFEPLSATHITVSDDFCEDAASGEFCFIEDRHLSRFESKLEKIIVYKWNRKYPGDFFLDIPLSGSKWKLISTTEFEGKSHDCITEEVYQR